MDEFDLRALIVEGLGAFALCFMGISSIVMTFDGSASNLVAVAFAHGLAIGLMVVAAGHISGGHFNPAVTIAMFVARRITLPKGLMYIVAQLIGAVLGAGAVTLVFNDLDRNADAVNLGLPQVGNSLTEGIPLTTTNAVIMEAILTFFLVFVIFGTAVDRRSSGKWIAGLAIGLTITMGNLAGAGVSGAALNPARWFGPAVIQNDWTDGWIWLIGPIVGGIVAAFVYNDVLMGGRDLPGLQGVDIPDNLDDEVQESAPAAPARRRSSRRR